MNIPDGAPAPQTPPAVDRPAETRTFLIADIRGYTTYTVEHGDEAAAELAHRFAGLVREVVEAREGFLIELRGDEALVAVISARQALRGRGAAHPGGGRCPRPGQGHVDHPVRLLA